MWQRKKHKKKPAEATGAITQTTDNGGVSISCRGYQIQPFRIAALHSYHNCGLFEHWTSECRKLV